MEIKIKDNLYLRSDDRNYILSEKRIKDKGEDKGKESWEDLGYYKKLDQLLQEYKDIFVRRLAITSFTELLKAYQGVDTTTRELGRIASITGAK